MIEIITIASGPLETNCYLVVADKLVAIVDPAPEAFKKIQKSIQEKALQPTHIILTHSHWDHFADCAECYRAWKLPILVHEEDAPNLIHPGSDGIPTPYWIEGCVPSQLLHDGDKIMIGNSHWKVIHTPGHSPGGICLYCPEEHILLAGDTLFKGSIGRLSFSSSQPERMWPSLKKLSQLPAETIVYPGHGPSTTIDKEKWLSRAEEVFG